MPNAARESGFFSSLKKLLGTVLEIAQIRLELIGTEVELEKRRIFDGLLWASVALLCLGIGLVLLCGFVILLLWDGYRLAAVGVLSLLFVGIGIFFALHAKKRIQNSQTMFSTSLNEFKQDQTGLQQKNDHAPL
jgi:uncharacterized membrane protein YqjE